MQSVPEGEMISSLLETWVVHSFVSWRGSSIGYRNKWIIPNLPYKHIYSTVMLFWSNCSFFFFHNLNIYTFLFGWLTWCGNKEALNFISTMRKKSTWKSKDTYMWLIQIWNVCIYCNIHSWEAGTWQKNERLEPERDELINSVSGTDFLFMGMWRDKRTNNMIVRGGKLTDYVIWNNKLIVSVSHHHGLGCVIVLLH